MCCWGRVEIAFYMKWSKLSLWCTKFNALFWDIKISITFLFKKLQSQMIKLQKYFHSSRGKTQGLIKYLGWVFLWKIVNICKMLLFSQEILSWVFEYALWASDNAYLLTYGFLWWSDSGLGERCVILLQTSVEWRHIFLMML